MTADDVRARAEQASDRLDLDRWLLRLLVIFGGLVVATLGIVIERFAVRLGSLDPSSGMPTATP